jgi:hypothetical protein
MLQEAIRAYEASSVYSQATTDPTRKKKGQPKKATGQRETTVPAAAQVRTEGEARAADSASVRT